MLFPELPLLQGLEPRVAKLVVGSARLTAVVGVQHLLDTTGSLIEALLRLGVRPENVVLLGKSYSSSPQVVSRLQMLGVQSYGGSVPQRPGAFRADFTMDVDRLWQRAIDLLRMGTAEHLLVFDDGGLCLSRMPAEARQRCRVAGIEQTTSGLVNGTAPPIPVVEVASSAAKRLLESPMIARAVVRRVPNLAPDTQCGVVGVGSIGRAVARHLSRRHASVLVFDRDASVAADLPPGTTWCSSLHELVQRAEWVFGCSGQDVFHDCAWIDSITGSKTLVSCSSEDREFRSILRRTGSMDDPFGTFRLALENATVRVLRGGFPLNFDGSTESVPAEEIQLTRCLLYSAAIQSLARESNSETPGAGGVMLSPTLQSVSATSWLERYPEWQADHERQTALRFQSLDWISARSGGRLEHSPSLEAALL